MTPTPPTTAQQSPPPPPAPVRIRLGSPREVIFREISKRSGEVIDQIPGEVMLKLRAYQREVTNPEPDHKVLEKTT